MSSSFSSRSIHPIVLQGIVAGTWVLKRSHERSAGDLRWHMAPQAFAGTMGRKLSYLCDGYYVLE
jgi:hypothetical protein